MPSFNPGRSMLLALALALPAAPASASGDAAAGKQIFNAQCAMCHAVLPGSSGIGPSLAGVYGQPAASQPDYDYSPALKNAHLTWTAASLDKFLASPQAAVPGTKMPFAGLPDATQRADVIAFLAALDGK